MSRAEIKWPAQSTVDVSVETDFVYIIRKDNEFTVQKISENISSHNNLELGHTKAVLAQHYDTFIVKLTDILSWGFAGRGKCEIHLYNPDALEGALKEKASQRPIVSLDPLMSEGVHSMNVSRGYFLGGKQDFGQIARPGSESLDEQASKLKATIGEVAVALCEDDIFSGGSVTTAAETLIKSGVDIETIVAGIQVGNPTALSDMGIDLDSVVSYATTDGSDIFEKVDLGDPRDYFFGASGLVVKLPDGNYGRSPYIVPFVSTHERAGIPLEIEREFGLAVLKANLDFFCDAEKALSTTIMLQHMDTAFGYMMHELYGVPYDISMVQLTTYVMENIDRIWEITQHHGGVQEALAPLELPKKMVLLDVNGTLIADDAIDGSIDPISIRELQGQINRLKAHGVSVGLCSDSPLPQLLEYAKNLGIEGPIVAENGNIVYHNSYTVTLKEMPNIAEVKALISELTNTGDYKQIADCVAVEFGGSAPNSNGEWAFGANRETSVTVFGPADFIVNANASLESFPEVSVDYNPLSPNYLMIHTSDYRQAKSEALSLLTAHGSNIVMVGNSMSDWIDPKANVRCAFVGGARISETVIERAEYLSDKPLVSGVIDILGLIK
ncbi:MAG: HAD hydrolase family protein [Patescibacteria group bacterium]